MIEFNKVRKCWVGDNVMFIPCKTIEFSKYNGNQQAIVQLVKKKPAKDDQIVSVFGEEYVLKRFLMGDVPGWITHSNKWHNHLYGLEISTTDKPAIKEQQSLF